MEINRNLWTQREIVMMGKFLQFKNWDRRAIKYWTDRGLFPKPVAFVEGMISFYSNKGLALAFVDISRRLKNVVPVEDEDVDMAKAHVLEDAKAKNVTMMIEHLNKMKGKSVCKKCGDEDVRVNSKGLCYNCNLIKLGLRK